MAFLKEKVALCNFEQMTFGPFWNMKCQCSILGLWTEKKIYKVALCEFGVKVALCEFVVKVALCEFVVKVAF